MIRGICRGPKRVRSSGHGWVSSVPTVPAAYLCLLDRSLTQASALSSSFFHPSRGVKCPRSVRVFGLLVSSVQHAPTELPKRSSASPLQLEILENRVTPATLTVNTLLDGPVDGTVSTLSLREAIALINADEAAMDTSNNPLLAGKSAQVDQSQPFGANDTIRFDPFLAGQTIMLTAGTLTLGTGDTLAPIAITGPSGGVTISGNNKTTVFTVDTGTTATLSGLIIAKGSGADGGGIMNEGMLTVTASTFSSNSGGFGGGIFNASGTLTVTASTFSSNSATEGGGIYNASGTLTVTASTFSGNSSLSSGAGIFSLSGAATISKSTFSSNVANFGGGGGIASVSSTMTVTGSTFTGNSAFGGGGILNESTATLTGDIIVGNGGGDLAGNAVDGSSSFNLIGNDGTLSTAYGTNGNQVNVTTTGLKLAPLGNYGGPTQTFALLPGSIAIGKAPSLTSAATDQRGLARPIGSPSDVGAFQSGPLVVNTTADSDGFDLLTLRDALNIADVDTTTTSLPITFDPTVFAALRRSCSSTAH